MNVPSIVRVAAGAFGFLTLIQVLDGLPVSALPTIGGHHRPFEPHQGSGTSSAGNVFILGGSAI